MQNLETNIDVSDHIKRCLSDYLGSLGVSPGEFRGKIADQDEMFHNAIAVNQPVDFAYFKYIESGRRTHDVMKQLISQYFDGEENLGSILEFASGHGRATRFMIQSIPPDRFWASDIYSDAMAFQRDYFNVNTIQSTDDPDDFHCDRKFDVITAMSLFSHLPEDLFERWLAKLASLLEENGVLFITTREAGFVRDTPGTTGVEKTGIEFERRSESDTLSTEIYGLTAVTDDFVQEKIRKFVSPEANVRVFRRGLYLNQTLYAISMRKPEDIPDFELNIPPIGGASKEWQYTDVGSDYKMTGWAVALDEGRTIEAVDVLVDGEVIKQAKLGDYNKEAFSRHFPGLKNKPKSWSAKFEVGELGPESIVKFRLKSDSGTAVEYYAPSLEKM